MPLKGGSLPATRKTRFPSAHRLLRLKVEQYHNWFAGCFGRSFATMTIRHPVSRLRNEKKECIRNQECHVIKRKEEARSTAWAAFTSTAHKGQHQPMSCKIVRRPILRPRTSHPPARPMAAMPLSLMSVPREIRNNILEQLLLEQKEMHPYGYGPACECDCCDSPIPPDVSIMRVSKSLNAEATEIL